MSARYSQMILKNNMYIQTEIKQMCQTVNSWWNSAKDFENSLYYSFNLSVKFKTSKVKKLNMYVYFVSILEAFHHSLYT